MDRAPEHAHHWSSELVAAVVEGAARPCVQRHLDYLLRWLASPDTPEVQCIDAEFRSRSLEPRVARRLALMSLEEALFGDAQEDPTRVLGVHRGATEEELRSRYRLLMRVYHPDLNGGDTGWLTERTERINKTYVEACRRRDVRPAPPPPALAPRRVRRRPRPALRIRRRLGDPDAFRRRFLVGVLLACAALVVQTCVANRAWLQWPLAAPAIRSDEPGRSRSIADPAP